MNVQVSRGINANFPKNQQEEVKLDKEKIEPKKDGNKKLALALGALAVAGIVTAGVVRGKSQNINNSLKNSIDDVIGALKKEISFHNNPKIKELNEMMKRYEDLLRKAGISEKTKQQINSRLEVLRKQKLDIIDSYAKVSEYLEGSNSKKLSSFIRKLRDNICELKYNPLTKTYEKVIPEDKKQAILREIRKYTGKDYTFKQLDDMTQLMHLEDKLAVIKRAVKSKSQIGFKEQELLDELRKKLSPQTIERISKAIENDKTKNKEASDVLFRVIDQIQNISGKSFKSLAEVEKFLAGISKSLKY